MGDRDLRRVFETFWAVGRSLPGFPHTMLDFGLAILECQSPEAQSVQSGIGLIPSVQFGNL